jgi:serine/threonine-protein kinase HipA
MPRQSKRRALSIWMNGIRAGQWSIDSKGGHEFRYADSWLDNSEARPISLSLPLAPEDQPYRGVVVSAYFDNLLPDSSEIRQRIRTRYTAASLSAFDLLAEVGRDCVGAIQLLPEDQDPPKTGGIEGRPIDEDEIENILKGLTSTGTGGRETYEEFRISLAGAQEKTALLWHKERWLVPHGSTPTTHIIKLPLGRIGRLGPDMSGSVENEWLCSRITSALGLQTARCEMARFGEVTALVITRFDRRISDETAILRLPQEDFCQVTGTPPGSKYEADGGPGIKTIMSLLLGSQDSAKDRKAFFLAQLLFWLLAAPDGHAKNFSVFIERGGRFRMTPLYDVISAYPVMGHGSELIPPEKPKLAMAFSGKNRHYEWDKIGPRHIRETARISGFEGLIDGVINKLMASIPQAVDALSTSLPLGFPASIADPIFKGLQKQFKLLEGT